MGHTLDVEAQASGRGRGRKQAEKGVISCLVLDDMDGACHGIVGKVDDDIVAQPGRDRSGVMI